MKQCAYLFIVTAAISSMGYSLQESDCGIQWRRDFHGNILASLQDVPLHELSIKLRLFIDSLKEREKGHAFIVELPHEQSARVVHLMQAGFLPHFIDVTKTEWVIKNGSPMPEASTAAAGVRVLIRRGPDVLVVEDKYMRGRLMFPGGSVDKRELSLDAAVREISEEVGLKLRPADLQKIALVNRVRANNHGTSDYCHYYLVHDFTGEIRLQESEIVQAFWCPLARISLGEPIENLHISPTAKLLADHVLNHGDSNSKRVLDPRQYNRVPNIQDSKDVMDIDLFNFQPKVVDEGKIN